MVNIETWDLLEPTVLKHVCFARFFFQNLWQNCKIAKGLKVTWVCVFLDTTSIFGMEDSTAWSLSFFGYKFATFLLYCDKHRCIFASFLCIKLPQLTMQGVRTGKGPVLILRQKRRIYNHLQPKQFCKKRSTQEPKKKTIPSHQNIPKKFCARFPDIFSHLRICCFQRYHDMSDMILAFPRWSTMATAPKTWNVPSSSFRGRGVSWQRIRTSWWDCLQSWRWAQFGDDGDWIYDEQGTVYLDSLCIYTCILALTYIVFTKMHFIVVRYIELISEWLCTFHWFFFLFDTVGGSW